MIRFPSNKALLSIALALVAAPLSAKEPVEEFLTGLRAKGYFDTARDYLESLKTNPNVDAATKARIPYELGRILVDDSKDEQVTTARLKQLEDAAAHFRVFVQKNAKHELAPKARIELGNVQVERARAVLDRANRANNTQKDDDLKTARGLFKEARAAIDVVVKEYDAKFKEFAKKIIPKTKKAEIDERKAVAEVLIEASFYAANTIYHEAHAYPAGSKERTALLTESAAKFHQVYQGFRTRLAGLFAGMWEGRCYQALGEPTRAVALYMELLAVPDEGQDAFLDVKAKVLHLAMECWLDPKENQPQEAEKRGEEWLKQTKPGEEDSPDGIAIRFRLAQAKHARILKFEEAAKKEKRALNAAEQAEKRRLELDIVNLTRAVSQRPGEFRKDATALMALYRTVKAGDPQTFADAVEQGKAAVGIFQEVEGKLKASKSEPEKEKLAKDRQIALNDAIRLLRLSIELKEKDKSLNIKEIIDSVNAVRYYLSFMYYKASMYEDAAIVGEMLAENYPQFAGSQDAGWISLAAWVTLYNSADARAGRKFESEQMSRVASLLTKKWPGSEKADEAWMILADIAIREGELEKAKEYLEKITKESPRRGEADIKLGQANWTLYLRGMRLEKKPAGHEKLATEAETYLKSGCDSLRKNISAEKPVNTTLLGGELSLAQIYVNRGTAGGAKMAIATLTQKEGLMPLFLAGQEIAKFSNFPEEAHKVLLRAYVTVSDIKKASEALDKLKSLSKDSRALMGLFVKLGQEIGEQLKTAAPAQKASLISAFDAFLQKILEDKKTLDYSSLHWVAETYVGLAEGLDKKHPAARQYYKQAGEIYDQMKEMKLPEREKAAGEVKAATVRKAADEELNPLKEAQKLADDTIDAIDTRRGRCFRGAGDYEKSRDIFVEILTRKENVLEAQKEVCFTFTEWARNVDPKYFVNARAGYEVKGRPVVWGWAAMSKKLTSFVRQPGAERLRDAFLEARFRLSESYKEHYRLEKNAKEKARLRDFWDRSISTFYLLYAAELKGSVWHKPFEDLLMELQKEKGESPKGFKDLDEEVEKRRKAVDQLKGKK